MFVYKSLFWLSESLKSRCEFSHSLSYVFNANSTPTSVTLVQHNFGLSL